MKTIKLVLIMLFSIAIASCGGGKVNPATQTLSGTAAQGAAIASATVTIKDKNGSTQTVTTGTDGKYTIDVTGKTPPFLLKIPAGTGYLYSVATATRTANIHPFTDLIIRNWYKVQGSNVETDFSGTSALAKVPTATEINTIEAVIRSILSTNLTGVGVTASSFNLLTSSFDANHTGFDKVLDNTKVAISTTGAVTVTATDPTTGISGTMVSTNLTTDLAVADTTKPSDPTGLSAIPASTTSIVLVWNASTDNVGVAGYNIYRGTAKVGTSPYPVYSDAALTSSTTYCYQMEAFDGAGNVSAKSPATPVCATTLVAPDTTAPSAPTNLTATTVSASQIDLSWGASTDNVGVAGYAIYRNGIKVASVNGTGYSDMGLSSGTLYSYTVKALDGALNLSVASNTASATTQAGIPAVPTGVSATAGNGQVIISWTAVSGATSYSLYMATQSGVTKSNYSTLTGGMTHPSITSPYVHTGLTNGTAYYFIVTAVNASGESVESAQVSATTPPSPVLGIFPDASFVNLPPSMRDPFDGTKILIVKRILLPSNDPQSFAIANVGPQGSILNYLVINEDFVNGFVYQNGTGSLPAGNTATVTVSVHPDFVINSVTGGPSLLIGSTQVLSIVTPDAANITKGLLSLEIRSDNVFNGTYTGSWRGTGTGANDTGPLTFTVTNGVITGTADIGSILSGTVSSSGVIAASAGGCTGTLTGQITITSTGGASITGAFSNSTPICGGSGTWTATTN